MTNGSLDASFSFDGKVIMDFTLGQDWAHSVSLSSTGDIYIVGGFELSNQDRGFLVGRLNSDGTLDNNFGNQGRKVIPLRARRSLRWVGFEPLTIKTASSSLAPTL
ncbi:MAG: hypothetical protein IPH53_00055 [Flavobacteriales bacterium]|nr:hypothetical protein [Flavobacteriales bacterium]